MKIDCDNVETVFDTSLDKMEQQSSVLKSLGDELSNVDQQIMDLIDKRSHILEQSFTAAHNTVLDHCIILNGGPMFYSFTNLNNATESSEDTGVLQDYRKNGLNGELVKKFVSVVRKRFFDDADEEFRKYSFISLDSLHGEYFEMIFANGKKSFSIMIQVMKTSDSMLYGYECPGGGIKLKLFHHVGAYIDDTTTNPLYSVAKIREVISYIVHDKDLNELPDCDTILRNYGDDDTVNFSTSSCIFQPDDSFVKYAISALSSDEKTRIQNADARNRWSHN